MTDLSVREAAERAHTSDRTVRRWIAEGKLIATMTADGWLIAESNLAVVLDARTDRRADADGHSSNVRPGADHVADLHAYIADLRGQLEARTREVQELHTLLAQAHHALPVPTTSPETRLGGPPANGTLEPTRGPFWRFLWPWARATRVP